MRRFFLILIAGAIASFAFAPQPARAVAQEDDIMNMYEQLMTPQEKALLEQFEQAQQRSEEG